MNGINSFTKGLGEVLSFYAREEYDRALARLEELRQSWPGNAYLLVLWARLVQLQDETQYSLDDAKRAMQQAIELEGKPLGAAIELGYFLDNIKDNPQTATKSFAHGIATARQLLINGLLGQAKALLQLDKHEDAVRCLVEAHTIADADRAVKKLFASRIEELFKDLGQMQSA